MTVGASLCKNALGTDMGGDATDARFAGDRHRGDDLLIRAYRVCFLAYLAAVAAFQRDFSRLCVWVSKVPVFTGEAAILVLGVLLLAITIRHRQVPFRMGTFEWLVLTYLVIGVPFIVQGLARGYGLAVFRDAALVYYAVFALFALAFQELGGRLGHLVEALVAGAAVGALVWTVRFAVTPSLIDGHGVRSFAGVVSWLGVVGVLASPRPARLHRRVTRWSALAFCSFVVFLSAYRTMIAVVLAAFLVVLVTRARFGGQTGGLRPPVLAAWAGIMALLTGFCFALLPPPSSPIVINGPVSMPHALAVISHRWLAGMRGETVAESLILPDGTRREFRIKDPGSLQGSISFRRVAWGNALARIGRSPLSGIGFGPPAALFPDFQCEIVSSPLSNCDNAHNTFLTIAMRMGLPVLALFGAAVAVAFARAFDPLSDQKSDPDCVSARLVVATVCVSMATYGLMSLLLESPYLAVLFWSTLGGLAASCHDPGGRHADAGATNNLQRATVHRRFS